ncbi:polysaccharide deacetylase family protein [Actinomadura bangladeshensis]|uniref:Polysaccharide deacetylase family protein n=1 Tax=Actinomadura bangladeshensis TaxID=453573 RepID=A0A4R4P788_9ACTN|nr:polysaccharide deacetylase family protein [Actinomadura bangladeshensis]TDC18368.1 polysaccharide deacetylase family protein [Actinomadura bangladeshensis]
MRRLAAFSTAVLLPATLVTAPALPASSSIAAARAAATEDVPTYTPGIAGRPGGNGFDVAYRASTTNVLYRQFVDGAWSAPLNLAGHLIGGAAVAFAGGDPHVYGRGVDGRLWERIRVDGTWQPWAKVDDLLISTSPAAAGHPDGRVEVFVRDATDKLQTRTYTPGTGWSAWTALDMTADSAPAVAVTGTDTVRVVVTGRDHAVWTRTRTGTAWSDWASLGESTYSTPGIAADTATGKVWVFVRNAGTHRLRVRAYAGSWGDWQIMGGLYVDGPGAAFAGGRTVSVGRGRDGAFWSRTITGTTWTTDVQAWVPGPPPGVPSALRGKNVTKISTTSKVAALTFDSAWDASGVSSIRATLQRENVPATFFLVGDFARGFPVYSNLLAGSGFRIGDHSDTHPDFTKISDATAKTQVTAARTAIFNTNGAQAVPLFRFPYGAYTASDVTLLNGLGYVPVGWTVDSLGWQGTSGGQTADKVATRVLAAKTPGMIVLMHVGANPDDGTTLDADALPAIIKGLRDAGYSFTTLDALIP